MFKGLLYFSHICYDFGWKTNIKWAIITYVADVVYNLLMYCITTLILGQVVRIHVS